MHLCQTLSITMARGWLAGPSASLPIPLLVGQHGDCATGAGWGDKSEDCTMPVTVALPQCPRKVQTQEVGAGSSHCCLPAQAVSVQLVRGRWLRSTKSPGWAKQQVGSMWPFELLNSALKFSAQIQEPGSRAPLVLTGKNISDALTGSIRSSGSTKYHCL